MATLTIRNVDERIRQGLQRRAKARGVSMEEEVRTILSAKIRDDGRAETLAELAERFFGTNHGIESLELPNRTDFRVPDPILLDDEDGSGSE